MDEATGKTQPEPEDNRDPAAVGLGRREGLKSGTARAQGLTPMQGACKPGGQTGPVVKSPLDRIPKQIQQRDERIACCVVGRGTGNEAAPIRQVNGVPRICPILKRPIVRASIYQALKNRFQLGRRRYPESLADEHQHRPTRHTPPKRTRCRGRYSLSDRWRDSNQLPLSRSRP